VPPDVGPRASPMHPVDGDVGLNHLRQLMRDHSEGRFAHHIPCALVLGQSVVERDFLRTETRLLPARPRGPDVLRQPD
jgi:hypothetical protein